MRISNRLRDIYLKLLTNLLEPVLEEIYEDIDALLSMIEYDAAIVDNNTERVGKLEQRVIHPLQKHRSLVDRDPKTGRFTRRSK